MKNVKYCLTAFFLLLITVPFLGRYCMEGSNDEKFLQTENRIVTPYAELESLKSKHLKKYFNNLNVYISDRLSRKDNVVKGVNRFLMDPSYFLNINITKGIIGLDGYLFLGNLFEPVLDRHFKSNYSLENEERVYSLHSELSTLARSINANYFFFIAPDKHMVYCDKIPKWISSDACYQSNRVTNYLISNLEKKGVSVIYPLLDLRKFKNQAVYFKSDTHWNLRGAEIGYYSFIENSGIDLNVSRNYKLVYEKDRFVGDLINILGLSKSKAPLDYLYKIETDATVLWSNKNEELKITPVKDALAQGWDASWSGYMRNENADNNLKVLIFCDSFMTNMSPFFNLNFKEVFYYSRHKEKEVLKTIILEKKADIIIYESVERAVGV